MSQRPKEAFREGFVHAINEMRRLRAMGFSRTDEIASILEWHAATNLKAWSLEKGAAYNSVAAHAWNGSDWWEIRDRVFKRDGRQCAKCASTEELHVDHVHPVAEGGLPVLLNLQVLCRACNLQKGAR